MNSQERDATRAVSSLFSPVEIEELLFGGEMRTFVREMRTFMLEMCAFSYE